QRRLRTFEQCIDGCRLQGSLRGDWFLISTSCCLGTDYIGYHSTQRQIYLPLPSECWN
ncbi:hypothetical protein LEMLEM_LOCUS12190, partial [Lemmus lemmus]